MVDAVYDGPLLACDRDCRRRTVLYAWSQAEGVLDSGFWSSVALRVFELGQHATASSRLQRHLQTSPQSCQIHNSKDVLSLVRALPGAKCRCAVRHLRV